MVPSAESAPQQLAQFTVGTTHESQLFTYPLINSHARGLKIEVENPPLDSQNVDLNRDPNAMWTVLETERDAKKSWNFSLDENELVWAIFPRNQYAPEADVDDNSHYMTTFKLPDEFALPDNIPAEAKEPMATHLQKHLHGSNTFMSYNINYGPNSWKQSSMTWPNWHIHCCHITPKALQETAKRNIRILEPGQNLRDSFFYEQIAQLKEECPEALGTLADAKFLDPRNKAKYGYLPNGLALTLPADISANHFFQVLEDIDTVAKTIHRDVFSSCVSNYNYVGYTGWHEDYKLRSAADLQTQIKNRSELDQEFLRRTHGAITFGTQDFGSKEQNQKKRIFKAPCYSVAVWQAQDQYVIIADPHSFRKKGGLEAMGIELTRKTTPDACIEGRMNRAQTMCDQTRGSGQI